MVKAPCGIIGDIDGDGDITQADVDLANEWIVSGNIFTDDQLKRIDVNGNGEADIGDSVLLRRYVLGEIKTFPACPVNNNIWLWITGLGLLGIYILRKTTINQR